MESARVLGVSRVAWLGYADSGMTGWPQNSAPNALMNADLDEAARALADLLDAEDAGVVTGYDWHGGYGHPDHVMVHRIVRRAVELAVRRPRLLEVTMNRDAMRAMFLAARAAGMDTEDWDCRCRRMPSPRCSATSTTSNPAASRACEQAGSSTRSRSQVTGVLIRPTQLRSEPYVRLRLPPTSP
jgi:hypothetical protein